MIEVKSRSVETWGPLARCSDTEFNSIINDRKGNTKDLIKQVKKLKTYKIQFKKVWESDYFEIQAQDDYSVGTAAETYFKANADKIGFKEQPRGRWADSYAGYSWYSYVKVK
jgi:hypothetical protein